MKIHKIIVATFSIFFFSINFSASQTMELTIYSHSEGNRTIPKGRICSSGGGASSKACVEFDLRDPNLAFQLLHFQKLQQVADDTARTVSNTELINQKIDSLNASMNQLVEQIKVAHNQQLLTIRDQIITKLSVISLEMIDDDSVVKQIRSIVRQEVESAFEGRE